MLTSKKGATRQFKQPLPYSVGLTLCQVADLIAKRFGVRGGRAGARRLLWRRLV